jgi:hypothetical protein
MSTNVLNLTSQQAAVIEPVLVQLPVYEENEPGVCCSLILTDMSNLPNVIVLVASPCSHVYVYAAVSQTRQNKDDTQ